MKRITYTPTPEQAKFIDLYSRVQGTTNPQDILSFALDKLEQEQKSALYDKLTELLDTPNPPARSSVSATPATQTSATSSPEGQD